MVGRERECDVERSLGDDEANRDVAHHFLRNLRRCRQEVRGARTVPKGGGTKCHRSSSELKLRQYFVASKICSSESCLESC